jgi:rhodanese-related sulfurtransferase
MNNRMSGAEVLKLLRDAVLIVLLATLVGAVINGRFLWQIWSGQTPGTVVSSEPLPAGELLPMPVSLAELKSLPAGETILLDARSRDLYLQEHLPSARNLPWGEIETLLEAFRAEVPVDQPLVAYCSGYGCEDSFHLAQRLLAEGYKDVRVFEGGLPEWQDAGLPVEEGQP